jgi:hypothetical protein
VQNVSYTAYNTYCRGVGLVRSYSEDLNGAGWDAVLAAKNFESLHGAETWPRWLYFFCSEFRFWLTTST